MKKIFIMVCAAIALVSCGGKTAPSAADVVSDTTEDVTAVAAKTANEAADKAVEAVTTALDEQLKAGDAKTLAKTLASAKAAVEKLQSEGKTEEAAAYASKIKEYVDKNKEALTTAAKGDMTVADLVNGIANLPASVQQGAAAAKAAVNADASRKMPLPSRLMSRLQRRLPRLTLPPRWRRASRRFAMLPTRRLTRPLTRCWENNCFF